MMKTRDESTLTALIEKLRGFPDVLAIILFGSYAKNTVKEISDVDIAVIAKDPNKHIESEIGCMYSPGLDVVLFHRLPLHIQFEVFKHGRELFCRDEKNLLEMKRRVLGEYLEMSGMYERIRRRVLA